MRNFSNCSSLNALQKDIQIINNNIWVGDNKSFVIEGCFHIIKSILDNKGLVLGETQLQIEKAVLNTVQV